MLKLESYKKGIVFSVFFNAVAKSLTFLSTILIAYYFGGGEKTDVYFFTYNFVFLISVFCMQAFGAIVVPEAMRIRTTEDPVKGMMVLNCFFVLFFLLGATISFLLSAFFPNSFLLISKFDSSLLNNQSLLVITMSSILPMIILTNMMTEAAASYKYFTVPMICQVLVNTSVILFIYFGSDKLDLLSISIGLAIAYFTNLILLVLFYRKVLHWHFGLDFKTITRSTWFNLLYSSTGNFFSAASNYVGLFLLSGLSAGAVSALNYSQRVADVPNNLVTTQFSAVAAIKFNELSANSAFAALNELTIKSSTFLMIALFPITGILILFPEQIITILYAHGNLDEMMVKRCGDMVMALGLMLPMQAINTIVTRILMATQKVRISFVYQICVCCITIGLTFVGVRLFGDLGYPIALTTSLGISTFAIYWMLRFAVPFLEYGKILRTYLQLGIIAISFALLTKYLYPFVNLNEILKVLAFGLVYCGLYIGALYLTGYKKIIYELVSRKAY
jgi:putative peptidoglycan lipid II flippase